MSFQRDTVEPFNFYLLTFGSCATTNTFKHLESGDTKACEFRDYTPGVARGAVVGLDAIHDIQRDTG